MSDATAAAGTMPPPLEATPTPPPQANPPNSTPPEPTVEEQAAKLMRERGYPADEALRVATSWKCEQCNCAIGVPRDENNDCECPCHCTCCCEGFFRCYTDCECRCAGDCASTCECEGQCPDKCHYDPDDSDQESTTSNAPAGPTSTREPAQPPKQPVPAGSVTGESKQEGVTDGDGDETMPERPLTESSLAKLFETLCQHLCGGMQDGDADALAEPVAAAFFEKLYTAATQTGMRSKPDSALPHLSTTESSRLLDLMRTLIAKEATLQKFTAAITDVVKTSFRSSWKLERILADRCKTATQPPATGPNAWSHKTPGTLQATLHEDMAKYRFDPSVYGGEEVERLRNLCSERYAFAETTRKPIGDEWTIMMGIMSGTIVIRALPQFLKRCCNLRQFQWFHRQMVLRAEGELYAQLPPQAKIFDYNQTAKRLSETITSAAAFQNLDAQTLNQMLRSVKTISYNDEMKAIHFYFDTKLEAIQWEGMEIPFRNFKMALKNPDARYREIQESPTGERKVIIRPPKDGLQDNRYDNLYRLRCTNLTRTMDTDKFAQFLSEITGGGIKMGAPIDSYGSNSEFSLMWDFFAHGHECPPALLKVNRIMWREHAILLIHQGRPGAAPCHQCADTGHQASNCVKAEDDWFTESTIIVTEEMIAAIHTARTTWTTPEEARQLFEQLGDGEPTVTASTASPTGKHDSTIPDKTAATPVLVETTVPDSAGGTSTLATPTNAGESEQPVALNHLVGGDAAVASAVPSDSSTLLTATPASSAPPLGHVNQQPEPVAPISSGWKTAMSRFSRNKHRQGQAEATGSRTRVKQNRNRSSSTPDATKTDRSTARKAHQHTPREESSDDDDTATDEDHDGPDDQNHENEPAPRQTGNRPQSNNRQSKESSKNRKSGPTAGQGQQNRRNRQNLMQRREEEDALEAAVARNNMTRVGMTVLRNAARARIPMDKDACLAAIKRAQLDVSRVQTSRSGTLEAIGGTLVNTPSTGNCQYSAVAETLFQLAFAAKTDQEQLVECVMMLKFLIYLAASVDMDVEQAVCNLAAILDFPASEVEGLTDEELKTKMAEHYAAVATSSSELNYLLPVALWGRTDSLRLMAKGLGRKIYVITASSVANVVHHHLFKPQRIKDTKTQATIPSAVMQQLGYQEWLEEIKSDVEAGETPIVLSYANDHYNAVLMTAHPDRTRRRAPTTSERTLTDLWGPAPHTTDGTDISAADNASRDAASERGPTRTELIASQSSVQAPAVFRALSQENWSRHEKKAAIDALVHGHGRLKELLAFCGVSDDDGNGHSTSASEEMDLREDFAADSDSSFTPPSPLAPDGPKANAGSEDGDAVMVESQQSVASTVSSAYSLPTPTPSDDYMEWAQVAWGRLCEEWAGQDGIVPPLLADRKALAKFAAQYPEVMTELGQQHPNPFIVLEHLKDADIKNWCAGKRFRYCLAELDQVITTVTDAAAKQMLSDWVADIRGTPVLADQITKYRDTAKWASLKAEAGTRLKKSPLLTMQYSKESAFVVAVDELFPHLASDIQRAEGHADAAADLMQIYGHRGDFAGKVDQAIAAKKWDPLVEYVRALGIHLSQPQPPTAPASRC